MNAEQMKTVGRVIEVIQHNAVDYGVSFDPGDKFDLKVADGQGDYDVARVEVKAEPDEGWYLDVVEVF